MSYEVKQLVFLAYLKNGISPKTTSQWCHRWAGPISKVALLSYGSADVFTDSLAQSVRELWSFIALSAMIVDSRASEGCLFNLMVNPRLSNGNCTWVHARRLLPCSALLGDPLPRGFLFC